MTEIMEARRKWFEEWILSSFMSDGDRDLVLRDEFGEYYSVGVSERWEMYNAALDSVCVELPRVPNFDISAEESLEMDPDDYEALEAQHSYMVDVYRECRSAIERAGLKVKP